jgi:hypothetical protein
MFCYVIYLRLLYPEAVENFKVNCSSARQQLLMTLRFKVIYTATNPFVDSSVLSDLYLCSSILILTDPAALASNIGSSHPRSSASRQPPG